MNLLFYRYGSICEPFLLKAFKSLGVHVTELDYEIHTKNASPLDCINRLSQVLMDGNYNLVFSINFFPTVSDVCNIFHIPYAGWTVDCPVMELFNKSITNSCNYLFLFDRCQYEEIAPLNPGHIFYLPLATDPDYMQSVIKTSSPADSFSSDIAFVGSLYTEKCAYDRLTNPPEYLNGYLNGIMAAQLKVYGYYFINEVLPNHIIADFKKNFPGYYSPVDAPYLTDEIIISQLYIGNKISALERKNLLALLASHFCVDIYTMSDTTGIPNLHNCGSADSMTEMPLIFHNSTINLNMTSKPIRSGIPLRIWDILGCKGFTITNFQAEIPEYFTPGEDIEVYESEEDLIEKCRYYLAHPKRAKEIAENAFDNICKNHTYQHRMEALLRTIFETNN